MTRFSTDLDVETYFREFDDLSVEYSGWTMQNRTRYWAHWVVEGVKAEWRQF